MPDASPYDCALVGGGIVGLATARALLEQRPELRLAILEKEDRVATHQTGRNSGVIHAGLYYRPGTRKARLCRQGKADLEAFCTAHGIPWTRSGKLVLAVSADEVPRLDALEARAAQNGVETVRCDADTLREHEPHARGVAALWVPETGVVDYSRVAAALAAELRSRGVEIRTGSQVCGGRETERGVEIHTARGTLRARALVNCAGLWADRVTRLFGAEPGVRLIPFRGEYAELIPEARELVRGLIYPVPDPAFPFLGVHLTRTVDGRVEAGPSAALAFAREGYTLGTVRPSELAESLSDAGFRRLARRHWRMGATELARSLSPRRFWAAARRLVPALPREALVRGAAGVRAQAVTRDGDLADDFVLVETARAVHVVNAPSPAATASLAIGREIAERALERLA